MNEEAEENCRYWKAAISHLPTQEMRDAAWEFFVRHFSQNPRMADTLSGLILVMQANGLYMLEAPKMVREQIVDPLNEALTHFGTDLDRAIDRHNDLANGASQTMRSQSRPSRGLTTQSAAAGGKSMQQSWPSEFMPNWNKVFFNRSQSNAGYWNRRRRP